MKLKTSLTLSTSPQTHPARKLRVTARFFYGRTRQNNTGKERDSETGLYYYGARYLDPKISRWLSGDPATGEYVPQAGKGGDGLPGMGGVYNTVNLHVYHYAGNNPVKYTDPDGNEVVKSWYGGMSQLNLDPRRTQNASMPSNTSQSNGTVLGRRGVDFGSLVTQVGLRDSSHYNTARAEKACYALTFMSAVQDFTGVPLGDTTVMGLMDGFYDSGKILSTNEVFDIHGILNATLEAVGRTDLIAEFKNGVVQDDRAAYTVLEGTSSWGTHFNLGDKDGDFLFDPWHGKDSVNTGNSTRGVIIFRQREE